MTTFIHCHKLNAELPALSFQPYPGKLGIRILAEISEKAWQMWLAHQTTLINEYRLNLLDPEARKFLSLEMENFLFGNGSEKPEGFVPV